MKTSIFDIFKIGIGPSSSHTVGPMRAAGRFVRSLQAAGLLGQTSRVLSELYGSLALTGIGHGTDRAVLLGLSGETPEEVETSQVERILCGIRESHSICLLHSTTIPFREDADLLFHSDQLLPGHPNGMRFSAFDRQGSLVASETYYSIGGGFIIREGEHADSSQKPLPVPFPFSNGAELLEQADLHELSVA